MEQSKEVTLAPMHRLPILIVLLGSATFLIPIPIWVSILIASFGVFLFIQSLTLKLKFTKDVLIVLQLGKQIRCFPFKDWLAWRIFLPQLPGILYFREKASPHLLPILFDREMLEKQLKLHVGSLEITKHKNTQ